jgi:hypothetical protein
MCSAAYHARRCALSPRVCGGYLRRNGGGVANLSQGPSIRQWKGHVPMLGAGLAHDRSPPRERQARSSFARSCAPRPIVLGTVHSARGSARVICDGTEVESQISRRARAFDDTGLIFLVSLSQKLVEVAGSGRCSTARNRANRDGAPRIDPGNRKRLKLQESREPGGHYLWQHCHAKAR